MPSCATTASSSASATSWASSEHAEAGGSGARRPEEALAPGCLRLLARALGAPSRMRPEGAPMPFAAGRSVMERLSSILAAQRLDAGGSPRFAAIDAARGVALAAMVVFHFAFDLDSLGLAALDVGGDPRWRWFARLIAGSFLALSGMSLVIAHAKGMRWEAYLRRLAILAGAAVTVTLATWLMMPREFIFFGILHSIAVASVIGLAFLRLPWPVTISVAILVLVAPNFIASAV